MTDRERRVDPYRTPLVIGRMRPDRTTGNRRRNFADGEASAAVRLFGPLPPGSVVTEQPI
jgi:hypothetical protein